MSNSFIHLHLHSEYSISDSLIRIEELIDHVSKNKSPAVAITDNNNIFSLIKFYKTAIRKGVKPIIGIEINLEDKLDTEDFSKVVLLCKNLKGFQNLSSLITESYINLILSSVKVGLIKLLIGSNDALYSLTLPVKSEKV